MKDLLGRTRPLRPVTGTTCVRERAGPSFPGGRAENAQSLTHRALSTQVFPSPNGIHYSNQHMLSASLYLTTKVCKTEQA